MDIKYNSQAAHKLLIDMDSANSNLNIGGNNLVNIHNTTGWNDKQKERLNQQIISILKKINNAKNMQTNYKKELAAKIAELES